MPDGTQAQTLAQLVRAKYPGAYDDMDDSALESSVLAKHPEYSDLPRTQKPIPGAPNGLPGVPKPQVDMQGSYIGHAINAPKLSMQPGLPSPAQNPENATRMSQGAAIGAPIEGVIAGGARALPFIARSLLGATAGSALGGWGGKEVGGLVGHPDTGAQIGATVGGLAGGYAGARGQGVPTRSTFLNKILGMEERAPVDPVAQAVKTRTAAWLPTKVPPPEPPIGSPENPGWMAKLPARMPKPVTPEPPLGSPENPGWYAKLPNRMPQQAASLPKQRLPFLPDATPSNIPVGNAQLPPVGELKGSPTLFPTIKPKAQVTGSAAEPFEPLVFSSPEEAAAHDVRMKNLKRQASSAGTYHAAQGAAGKRTNLQQRIQRKEE